jgi:ketosteroid isomerase-like protein
MTLDPADRFALADLVHGYSAAVDDGRLDDAAALFADDAQLVLPDPPQRLEPVRRHSGRAAIRAALESVAAVSRTEHAIVGELYSGNSAAASGRIACVAHHWSRHGEEITDLVWHIRYDDSYVRTRSGWRILLRELTLNAIETLPARRIR